MAEENDIQTPTGSPTRLPASAGSSRFGRWPLNVNPEMDRHAAKMGLPHWSCVSTKANNWWIRADGQQFEAFLTGSRNNYMEELEAFDLRNPMNEALQRPDEVGSVARSGSPAKRESGPQQSAEAPRSPAKREIS